MAQLLQNKVAIVTGGASGIGESTAVLFAAEGATVVVADVDENNGVRVVQKIKDKNGRALFVKTDTSKPSDVEQLVKTTVKEFGKLNVAVNNAGIGGASAPMADYPLDAWDTVIAINLSGVFYGMKYQIPELLKAGGGTIVNIGSILSQVGFANSCAYVAAKHGVVGLTKNAALEYSAKGIRVNAVGPAFIKTPLLEDNLTEQQLAQITPMHPIGRMGEASEVAEMILWLACEKSSFVTGSYHAIDGAYLAM